MAALLHTWARFTTWMTSAATFKNLLRCGCHRWRSLTKDFIMLLRTAKISAHSFVAVVWIFSLHFVFSPCSFARRRNQKKQLVTKFLSLNFNSIFPATLSHEIEHDDFALCTVRKKYLQFNWIGYGWAERKYHQRHESFALVRSVCLTNVSVPENNIWIAAALCDNNFQSATSIVMRKFLLRTFGMHQMVLQEIQMCFHFDRKTFKRWNLFEWCEYNGACWVMSGINDASRALFSLPFVLSVFWWHNKSLQKIVEKIRTEPCS